MIYDSWFVNRDLCQGRQRWTSIHHLKLNCCICVFMLCCWFISFPTTVSVWNQVATNQYSLADKLNPSIQSRHFREGILDGTVQIEGEVMEQEPRGGREMVQETNDSHWWPWLWAPAVGGYSYSRHPAISQSTSSTHLLRLVHIAGFMLSAGSVKWLTRLPCNHRKVT